MYCIFFIRTAPNANAGANEVTSTASADVQITLEEGKLRKNLSEINTNSSGSLDLSFEGSSHPPINYPVGKPLEVKYFPLIFM